MKNKKILFSIILFFAVLLFSNICMAGDLDVINDYTITVEPRKDGSLDMTYHLEWKVLDSVSEGPLTWVKIGIPNSNVNGISAISKNIQGIRYYQDGGDFIRIDFNQSYNEGDVLDIDFKFHQSYMYNLTDTTCEYSFTPGWFDDINVKKLTILWKSANVSSSTAKRTNSDGYLVWTTSLLKGKKYPIEVIYPKSVFNASEEMQAAYATTTPQNLNSGFSNISTAIALLIVISIIFSFISMFSGGGYYSHRGYGYRGYRSSRSYSSHRSSCACVSSCACACACAGGGRAGCSKKDFYGTNLQTQKLNKVLNTI